MASAGNPAARARPGLAWLAARVWVRDYRPAWLGADLVAGITLAAYLLPAAIGDASLAGLGPQAGLYACIFSGLVFWLFSSSRHTAITVTSAISLLVGTSLGAAAGGDPARHAALAACTALMVAAIGLIAWAARAGAVIRFISETVLVGFKAGVAFVLTATQLPKLFGFTASHGDFWERMADFLARLGDTNTVALSLGSGALLLLVLGKRYLAGKPVALVVVVAGIALSAWADLEARGVKMLGEVPQGLPPLGLPRVGWHDVNDLLPLALACFLLAAVETTAIGKTFGRKHGYRPDPNQEFLALAGANLAAGLGRGFPVSGGLSQSLVGESAGARTPLTGLFAALVVLGVALFLSGLLRSLPQPVLAAIVLAAVPGLVSLSGLRRLWHDHRSEFLIATAAFLGVLGSGILRGVLIGAIISMVLMIRRAARPNVAILGRIPGTRRFSDLERHPDNESIPGLLIFRVEVSLLYFNVDPVREAVWEAFHTADAPVRLVIADLSNTPHVDVGGAEMLAELHHDLAASGAELALVEAHASVRDMLRLEGLEERLGPIDRFTSVADLVDAFLAVGFPEGGRHGPGAPDAS